MIENTDDLLVTEWSDEEWDEIEASEREEERLNDEAIRKIVEGFDRLCHVLGYKKACRQTVEFIRQRNRPEARKGRHDRDFDQAILAAHQSMPSGKKLAAVMEIGAAHSKTDEATRRRLRRLLKEKTQLAAALKAWRQRGGDK